MKVLKRKKMKNQHAGTSFDSFLEEQGIRETVDASAKITECKDCGARTQSGSAHCASCWEDRYS